MNKWWARVVVVSALTFLSGYAFASGEFFLGVVLIGFALAVTLLINLTELK